MQEDGLADVENNVKMYLSKNVKTLKAPNIGDEYNVS